MKRAAILGATLLLAVLPAPGSRGLYITEINHTTGRFQLSNRTSWGALRPGEVKNWRAGDDVTVVRDSSCSRYDPNMYLLTGTDESESACAQRIGR